jgi:hypothetical protein
MTCRHCCGSGWASLYRVETDSEAMLQIAALPDEALSCYAEVLTVLELTPWNGAPYHRANPEGALRHLVFGPKGEGLATYLVLENQLRVDVLRVHWLPVPDAG